MKTFPLYTFAILFFIAGIQSTYAQSEGYNYNEDEVPEYTLPDLLRFSNGDKVASAEEWTIKRRPEILALFEENVYGKTPEDQPDLNFELTKVVPDFMNGDATLKEVSLLLTKDTLLISLNFLIIIPNNRTQAAPAFIGLNFRGNHTIHPSDEISITNSWIEDDRSGLFSGNKASELSRGVRSHRWPVERIIDRGYALITCYYGDIDPDYPDDFKNGIFPLFAEERTSNSWGSIAAWSWGLSRMVDYIETDSMIDDSKVAVIGHSRLGKTSLWAGAQDERFALVISNNSGCGGAALSRRAYGETIERITHVFPHWFCENYSTFANNENAAPIDQHMLIALIAPRPVYIASAENDLWADPKGEFLSGKFANPVYKLLGTEGLPTEEMPCVNRPVQGQIGYHKRTGKHDLSNYDWEQYLDFADKHLVK